MNKDINLNRRVFGANNWINCKVINTMRKKLVASVNVLMITDWATLYRSIGGNVLMSNTELIYTIVMKQ
jgi:hypothetical protein